MTSGWRGLGVLKSWAVPKGVPEKPGDKRLAVETEDHPLEYREFEGTIPQGQYGAGTVKIWDKGSYKLLIWDKDKIEFILTGERLDGRYVLARFKKAGAEAVASDEGEGIELTAKVHIGTMGWSYNFWTGNFYPKDLAPENFLSEYAKHFDTVEVDNTFYRIPSKDTVEKWRDQTPPNFLFSAKFPRRITHEKMLRDCEEIVKGIP